MALSSAFRSAVAVRPQHAASRAPAVPVSVRPVVAAHAEKADAAARTKGVGKGALVSTVAQKTELTASEVADVFDALIETIQDTVTSGERVTIVGFGTFEPRDRKARDGRNPATGQAMKIPAAKVPAFKASKKFKDQVNGTAAPPKAAKPAAAKPAKAAAAKTPAAAGKAPAAAPKPAPAAGKAPPPPKK